MRILQLTSHLNLGGIAQYVLSLSRRLQAQGHHITVGSDSGDLEYRFKELGVKLCRLPFHTSAEFSPPVFWGTRRLARILKKNPVDLIHAHTRVAQVAADRLSRQLEIPYVTTWHGIYKPRLGRMLWPCLGTRTIAISSPVRQHLLEDFHVPEDRVRLIYNGVDTAHYAVTPDLGTVRAYKKRWDIPEGKPVIGGIGRLASGGVKGFDLILTAASLLKETMPHLHVLIVGDGPRRPFLEGMARRLKLQERVHFVGPSDDVRVPLATMDVFVFSSRWPEAFGLTLVEAMAAGKPIVATRAGAVPEIVQHGESGWLVTTENPEQMAEGIERLLSDRSLADKFGLQAQVRVRENFDAARMARQIEAVYEEAVSAVRKR